MIPKIIHYCWLSGDKYPASIDACISTWKTKLPDYEFILWDKNRFDVNSNTWVKEAFASKKYAFAADYIRLYAVYQHGGIYLDSDVEIVKSFDDLLLSLPYFIGSEGDGNIEAGVFGAERECAWVKDCLAHYDGRSFIKKDGSLDTQTLPRIMMEKITKKRKIQEITLDDVEVLKYKNSTDTLFLLPQDCFCAKNHGTGIIAKTNNTYCIHHFAMSWIPKRFTFLSTLKKKLMAVFGVTHIERMIAVCRLKELRSFFRQKTITK